VGKTSLHQHDLLVQMTSPSKHLRRIFSPQWLSTELGSVLDGIGLKPFLGNTQQPSLVGHPKTRTFGKLRMCSQRFGGGPICMALRRSAFLAAFLSKGHDCQQTARAQAACNAITAGSRRNGALRQ